MPSFRLHQPLFGKAVGETHTLTDAAAVWYVENGYVSPVVDSSPDPERGRYATSADADNDPTLAENREDPGAEPQTASPSLVAPATPFGRGAASQDAPKASEPKLSNPEGDLNRKDA